MKYKFIFILIVLFQSNIHSQIKVIYPNINGFGKTTFSYAALDLALKKSEEEYEIQLLDYITSDSSVRQMLKQGKIDVGDFGTSQKFENEFMAIYLPIDFGLNGWRLFIIHRDNTETFSKIKVLEDLQIFSAGQGEDWADVKILEYANISVIETPQMESLFAMIEKKRFDFLPLGAHSVFWHLEKAEKTYPSLTVDKNIVLIYPFARFFFVNKKNKKLHDIIRKGLEIAFEDGSLFELFRTHKNTQNLFLKADLKNRIQIDIENPLMSEEFKKIPKEYFFDLSYLDE